MMIHNAIVTYRYFAVPFRKPLYRILMKHCVKSDSFSKKCMFYVYKAQTSTQTIHFSKLNIL